jgi:hypothetical protein
MRLKERQAETLDYWLKCAKACRGAELIRFASGIYRDYAAVYAACSRPESNGLTEGHVNRLKFLKRQMFGRAQLDLLRIKVLHAVESASACHAQITGFSRALLLPRCPLLLLQASTKPQMLGGSNYILALTCGMSRHHDPTALSIGPHSHLWTIIERPHESTLRTADTNPRSLLQDSSLVLSHARLPNLVS